MLKQLLSLTPGSSVRFTDEASILESSGAGRGLVGIEGTVTNILDIRDKDNLAEWLAITIDSEGKEFLLLAKRVDELLDLYKYQYSEFPRQNRAENIKSENLWLFQEPTNENWQVNNLLFSTTIPETTDKGETFTYNLKAQGERSGKAIRNPEMSGIHHLIATVAEYLTEDKSREALILEVGTASSEAGGVISLYTGVRIQENEVKLFVK